jgi:hypothetical protein
MLGFAAMNGLFAVLFEDTVVNFTILRPWMRQRACARQCKAEQDAK